MTFRTQNAQAVDELDAPEMVVRLATPGRWLIIMVLALLLTGCAGFKERVGSWWASDQDLVEKPASVQDISAMEQVVRWLQDGEEARALELLEAELERNPEHRIANHLMRQITTDPEAMLGRESQPYRVQPGDSLSELAAEHLGDPLSFYILARYNTIQVPRLLRSGQTLRLPKRDIAIHQAAQPVTVAEQTPEEAVRELPPEHIQAENYLVAGRPSEAIALLSELPPQQLSDASIELLGESYLRAIERVKETSNYHQARQKLATAKQAAAQLNTQWQWVNGLEARVAAAEDLKLAEQALAKGDQRTALAHYNALLEVQPEHPQARPKQQILTEQLRDQHHESALILYRNQRLEEAIAHWQTALEFDPEHEASRVYLTRARELQRRLEALED